MVLGFRRVLTFVALALSVLALSQQVEAARVRKSWAAYSPKEKDLYRGAVQTAMDQGLQFQFAALHGGVPTTHYAHNNCGFLLWHRKFLLAYENMLRSLGPQYADVTIPYWNYFEDHKKHMAAGIPCKTLQECSAFLQDFGGSEAKYPTKTTVIGPSRVAGTCVNNGIAGHACANNKGVSGGSCDNCIVRGPWSSAQMFLGVTQDSIVSALRNVGKQAQTVADPHRALGANVEGGFHPQVHNDLKGTMSTMVSPYDPVFYGHHAMVDLMLYVHNKCGSGGVNAAKFDVFDKCSVTEGPGGKVIGQVDSNSVITMLYEGKPADDHPVLGKFFKPTGQIFKDFADTNKMKNADQQYSYQLDATLQEILQTSGVQCPSNVFSNSPAAAPATTTAAPKTPASGAPAPVTTTAPPAKATPKPTHWWDSWGWGNKHHRQLQAVEHHHHHHHHHHRGWSDDLQNGLQNGLNQVQDKVNESMTKLEKMAREWAHKISQMISTLSHCGFEVREAFPSMTPQEIGQQESLLECEAIRQKSGKEFDDYDEDFRKAFGVPEDTKPLCRELLAKYDAGELKVLTSKSCRQKYGEATGTKLTELVTQRKRAHKQMQKQEEHHHHQRGGVHVSIKIHSE